MPNSLTKGTVTEETINRMVQKAFEENALGVQELKEGYFNIAYKARLKDCNVVLKIFYRLGQYTRQLNCVEGERFGY